MALQVAAGASVVLVAGLAPRPHPASPARRVAAVGLAALGGAMMVVSARTLGRALTVFPRPRRDAPLVASGPYGVVRHPMYTSVLALAAATTSVGSPWAFLPAALLAAVLDRKADREETWLAQARPEYAAYRAAVRWRFLPGVR